MAKEPKSFYPGQTKGEQNMHPHSENFWIFHSRCGCSAVSHHSGPTLILFIVYCLSFNELESLLFIYLCAAPFHFFTNLFKLTYHYINKIKVSSHITSDSKLH